MFNGNMEYFKSSPENTDRFIQGKIKQLAGKVIPEAFWTWIILGRIKLFPTWEKGKMTFVKRCLMNILSEVQLEEGKLKL